MRRPRRCWPNHALLGRGGVLPWSLLAVGSVASLAANVAVAQPTVTGRLIAAWPSFALICSYELLMRHVRNTASRVPSMAEPQCRNPSHKIMTPLNGLNVPARQQPGRHDASIDLQRRAWQWATENRAADGSLPSGKAIAVHDGRHERWGRPSRQEPGFGRAACDC